MTSTKSILRPQNSKYQTHPASWKKVVQAQKSVIQYPETCTQVDSKTEPIILEIDDDSDPSPKKEASKYCINLDDSDDEQGKAQDIVDIIESKQPQIQKRQETKPSQEIITVDDATFFIPFYKHRNYNTHIKDVLVKISEKTTQNIKLEEVTKAITYFREEFMVHRQNKIVIKKTHRDFNFQIINNFHSDLAKSVFPKLIKFLLQKESDPAMYRIPIFEAKKDLCQNISKWQALFVMCCMAMCLIIQQKSDNTGKMFRFTHFIEFTSYFSQNEWKTRCIMEYLNTELTNYFDEEAKNSDEHKRMLTIKRMVCPTRVDKIMQEEKDKYLIGVNVPNDDVTMDDYTQELKICHTNEVLGGGQSLGGLSQEDIFFSAHTELHILLVLCEQMDLVDCVNLIGFKKYFRIQRAKYDITFDGEDKDYKPGMDQEFRVRDYISFVNHPKFQREQFREQFNKDRIDKHLAIYYWAIKSFVEMPYVKFNRVISGQWSFLIPWGEAKRRAVLLWIVSSMHGKDLVFCPYGDFKHVYEKDFFYSMKRCNVVAVYQWLLLGGKKMMIFRDNLMVYMLMVMDERRIGANRQ